MYRPCLHCEGKKYDEDYCPEICQYGEDRKRLKELENAVKHGRWIVKKVNGTDAVFACSECSREVEARNDYFGKPTEHIAKIYPYCHCGAKMELKE